VAAADVYFDDFYIVHQKNNTALQVLQASDYYPYGLSFNEYQADRLQSVGGGNYEPILRNRYRFQEQELQKDLDPDLGWYHYKYRMHDPAIGRFGGVDPLAEKYAYNSPYAFSENRLIDGVELEGAEFSDLDNYAWADGGNDDWQGATFAADLFSVKHSLYNVFSRPFGWEATFVQDEDGWYRTGWQETNDDFWTGSFKWGLDLLSAGTFGRGGGVTGGLFAKTPMVSNAVKQIGGEIGQDLSNLGDATQILPNATFASSASRIFEVGPYKSLKGVEFGLDAHHVGQQAGMKKFVPEYNFRTAPSILVPTFGHTRGNVVARTLDGIDNARQLVARDIFELRRMYPTIPNGSLQKLIQMNLTMYPEAFKKSPR
jgi:RHS repeat-associated protein